jgi:uncharacterized membrane protein YgcG
METEEITQMLRDRGRGLLVPVLFLFTSILAAQTKELHWSSFDVEAKLDAAGALHVVERHAMVFTGDWNGGERVFRVFPEQSLALESLTRIGADGTRTKLKEGDLSDVDRYAWKDGKTLRWRSRAVSDPAFDKTEIVYEIAYTLTNILQAEGNRYVLDNDFAFPDREYPIEKFSLALTLDPVWKPEGAFSGRVTRGILRPGEGVVVRVALEYLGTGKPAAGRASASPLQRKGLLAALAAAIVFFYVSWRRRDTALGRFAPLTPPHRIDRAWLEANLLSLSPEEAGALWDETIGAPEVAAVIARLVAQKKIATSADGKKLTMKLLVPIDKLSGYDHELMKGFFFGNRTETDTDAIKAHYKSSGFDPAGKIKPGLEKQLASHADVGDKAPAVPWRPTVLLFLAGAAALILSVAVFHEDPGNIIGFVIVSSVLYGIAAGCAYVFQKSIENLDVRSLAFLWFPAMFFWFAWRGAHSGGRITLAFVLGGFLVRLAMLHNVFNLAKTRNGPKRLARRKALASARGYFAHELGKPAPRLEDAWFPYVVAFGLTSEADHWFRAHGAASAGASAGAWTGGSSGSSGSSSSSSGSGGWTGGGGAYGGAGASGTWAVAAAGVAAGVATPSSGGGGGGGGGGGSSGGGGGGGW